MQYCLTAGTTIRIMRHKKIIEKQETHKQVIFIYKFILQFIIYRFSVQHTNETNNMHIIQ